jgi:hydrogenase nickel incorporation protein HypA/HybF
MHELPILRSIVGVALRHADEAGASRVLAVYVKVGELRGLDAAWVQSYFDFVTEGTPAAGASLRVNQSKALLRCRSCGAAFPPGPPAAGDPSCPRCAAKQIELVYGDELVVESIDVI